MRRSILTPFILIVLTLGARAASAQTTGTISGTVTASADASPIAFANVDLYGADHLFISTVHTDGSGAYVVPNLAAGTYYLRFSRSGFVSVVYNGIPCLSNACVGINGSETRMAMTATPLTVTANTTTTANASLDRGGTVSGTVTRAAGGTPVSGVAVDLYDTSTDNVTSGVTAGDGTYSIPGLPFGPYYAIAFSVDYLDVLYGGTVCPGRATPRCRIDSGTPIVVSAGAPTATADFSLPTGGTISGSVLIAHPVAFLSNIPIALYQGSALLRTATSNSTGGYSFSGLDPGTYFIRTNMGDGNDEWSDGFCAECSGAHPAPVTVTAGATTTVDFHLLFPYHGGISGTLTLTGLSVIGVVRIPDVLIYNSDGTLVQTWAGGWTLPGTGATVSVNWSALNLPIGTYYVRTWSAAVPQSTGSMSVLIPGGGYWIDELYGNKPCVAADCDPRTGTPIVVPDSSTVVSGINFTPTLGAQISGNIPDAVPGPDAAPGADAVPGVTTIEVFDSRGVLLPNRAGVTLGTPVIGRPSYLAAGLPAGTYYLLLQDPLSDARGILYNGIPCAGCAVTNGTPIAVTAGQVRFDIDFGTLKGQAISGTVRSDSTAVPANQPLGAITVEAYGPNGQLIASTPSFADGSYVIDRLPAGSYFLRTHNTRGFADQVYSQQTCGACDPLAGTALVVSSGSDVTGIDFALPQGQMVSGQVMASGGGPLANAGVLVYADSPSSPAAHVTTDGFGGYSATVPAGSYFVQTDPVTGFTQQIYNGVACPQGACPAAAATQVSIASTPVSGVNFTLAACTSGQIAPLSLAQAAVGVRYRQTVLTTGATGAVGFTVSSGTLPPGLSLDPNTGVILGTPTASGHFTFTVAAIDATGCAGARTYVLDVPPCAFTVSPQTVPVGAAGGSWGVGTSNSCGPITVSSNASWITVQSLVSPTVGGSVAPNTGGPRQGTVVIGSRVVTIFQSGAVASPPFGSVDAPADGAVVSGSVAITGWALSDVGVSQVQIYRDPVAGETLPSIFVGTATFVAGARPDVAAAFPSFAFSNRAGWGYLLLTNMLPNGGNGTFRLLVIADGTLIGTKVINGVNASAKAPFGAIDTPDQGATVSGSAFVNFGWALTPRPKMIPFDGSTIHVLLDGVDVGPLAAFNLFRPDVSNLFPGLTNSGGPIGYRVIDTTALSEGVHTIAWLATDDGGITTGIGSRFFTVQNSAWEPALRANLAVAPPAVSASELAQADATTAVPARVDGVDLGRKAASLASLAVDDHGARTVQMSNLQALQLSLAPVAQALRPADACVATYAGYLVVSGALRALPVGSSLDPAGTFYWHPGTAFFGTYQLLFVRTSCDGTQQRIPVSVIIR